jgi:hypothetical protein
VRRGRRPAWDLLEATFDAGTFRKVGIAGLRFLPMHRREKTPAWTWG